MPLPRHSPIAMLAFPRFQHSFGDLITANAFITDFTSSLIDGIFENIMWFGRTNKDYGHFERTARAAHYFLQEGNKIRPKDIAQAYAQITDEIIPALNNAGMALSEAQRVKPDDLDNRIKKYLESYKIIYEGLLRLICSPVVYAFGIAKHVRDKDFTPDDTGKIGLTALRKMEKLVVYSDNRLAIGLNSHVRNAYAHENYRILDDGKVELWDPNPHNTKRSWGPEIWSLEDLIILNDQLWVNALGITCALVIYDIKNRLIASDRGWITLGSARRLRREELKDTINVIADNLGFYTGRMIISGQRLSMTLKPKTKGIDQDSDLYMGYKNHTSFFKVKIWYEERRIIDQLTRLLIILSSYLETDTKVSIKIVSHEKVPMGVLSVDLSTILKLHLRDTEPNTVNGVRHIFKVDTVGEATTYVEHKGPPRFVGVGPGMPKPGITDSQ